MKKCLFVFSILILVFVFSSRIHAESIIDTGHPVYEIPAFSLNSAQWLAAQFQLTQDYTVTDVYGYMRSNPGTLTLSILGTKYDRFGQQIPDRSNQYFSRGFSVAEKSASDWQGLSGVNWFLPTGFYWVAFEILPGDTYSGAMPGGSYYYTPNNPAPNPLFREAYGNSRYYIRDNYLDFGVKIESNLNPQVPEPSSLQILAFLTLGICLFVTLPGYSRVH